MGSYVIVVFNYMAFLGIAIESDYQNEITVATSVWYYQETPVN